MEQFGVAAVSKKQARSGLRRIQQVIGVAFLVSGFSGAYLLATDGSLWILAISHAIGLVVIVAIDIVFGVLNLASSRRVFIPSIAAALLGVVLQLGDIATAPQYGMTIAYFASYLFGLAAFDILLLLQAAIIVVAITGRSYARQLSRIRSLRGSGLDYSRRSFIASTIWLIGVIGLGVVLGSVRLPSSTKATSTTAVNLPPGAIANVNDLVVGTPVYFQYPAGYPNVLLLKRDGQLSALSIACTHVCCECEYVHASNSIVCPCHGSVFDVNGAVVNGPATVPLPSIVLSQDASGNIFPTAVTSPGPCQV